MPPLLLPEVRRLLELVPQDRALLVLRLPAHEARPRLQQRLVHHLDPVAARLPLPALHLVARHQPRVDQLPQHLLRGLPLREGREQLLAVGHRPRPLGRHQVPEDLAHDPLPLDADAVHRRLGVLRERPRDAPDLLVRRPRQDLPLPVPRVPQTRDGEGQERQRAPRPLHRLHHLADEGLVLEPVAERLRRLHERAPQAVRREPGQRGQRLEDRRERLVLASSGSGSRPAATAARGRPPPRRAARGAPRSAPASPSRSA